MQRSKFTEAQIAFILRQVEEGTAAGEVCRNKSVVGLGCAKTPWR
jgi:putative transposase